MAAPLFDQESLHGLERELLRLSVVEKLFNSWKRSPPALGSSIRCNNGQRRHCDSCHDGQPQSRSCASAGDRVPRRGSDQYRCRFATPSGPQMGGDEGELGRGPDVSRRDVVDL
jgi:hypothetical protein